MHPLRLTVESCLCLMVAPSILAQTQFRELSSPSLPGRTGYETLFGDVDGDGDLDMLATGQLQSGLYLNDGAGSFSNVTASRMPAAGADQARAAEFGDVDGDGDLDIVLGNTSYLVYPGAQNTLYLNDGRGFFADVTATHMPGTLDPTHAVALGDVDSDGDLDIVFGNGDVYYFWWNTLYLNDGSGRFADASFARLPLTCDADEDAELVDVDGDGDLDIVFAAKVGRDVLLINDGGGFFENRTAQQTPAAGFSHMAVGDVDGDNDLDIVYVRGVKAYLWVNDGAGVFRDLTASQMPANPPGLGFIDVQLGDVDGDGDLDVVAANISGPLDLFLNNGSGVFTDVTIARMPLNVGFTQSMALGDVDRDGDPDIVISNNFFTNLHRQLSTPSRPFAGHAFDTRFHAEPGYGASAHTGFPVLGFGRSPIPIPLNGIGGRFLLDPTLLFPLPAVAIPQPSGTGTLQLTLPGNSAGATFYLQGLVVNNGTLASHFTGYTVSTIQ